MIMCMMCVFVSHHVGLLVYVDVRSGTDGCENRSQAIAHQLDMLGATVSELL